MIILGNRKEKQTTDEEKGISGWINLSTYIAMFIVALISVAIGWNIILKVWEKIKTAENTLNSRDIVMMVLPVVMMGILAILLWMYLKGKRSNKAVLRQIAELYTPAVIITIIASTVIVVLNGSYNSDISTLVHMAMFGVLFVGYGTYTVCNMKNVCLADNKGVGNDKSDIINVVALLIALIALFKVS